MNSKYQVITKAVVSNILTDTALESSERIVPFSVLKNSVAIGLYSLSEQRAEW